MRYLLFVMFVGIGLVGCSDSTPSSPTTPAPADTKSGKASGGAAKVDRMD